MIFKKTKKIHSHRALIVGKWSCIRRDWWSEIVDSLINCTTMIKINPWPFSIDRTSVRTATDTSLYLENNAVLASCSWSTRLISTREPSRVPWKPGAPVHPDRPRSGDDDGVRLRAAHTTIPTACHAGFRLPRPLSAI